MLHRVLYPKAHINGFQKKRKKWSCGCGTDAHGARPRHVSPGQGQTDSVYLVSSKGHVDVAQMFVERGADGQAMQADSHISHS